MRMIHRQRCLITTTPVVLLLVGSLAGQFALAAERSIQITHPVPYQVVQRIGFDPARAFELPLEAKARGAAEIEITGTLPNSSPAMDRLEFRITSVDREAEAGTWLPASLGSSGRQGNDFRFTTIVPAGWYRLEIRSSADQDGTRALGSLEPFGVGEVFVVAGQSYATNTNDERLRVTDPLGRVVAWDAARSTWAIAHDPQPAPDGSDGGSIWPALGDSLLQELHVPIAFANVAVGGTSSAQWLPEGTLHPRLIHAGQSLGRFRAVLWQQGESDVIAKTTPEAYVANLKAIRKAAVRAWGFEPVWLAAKSTHHPTVYYDPVGEGAIRDAIDRLWRIPGFGTGPDTDMLTGEHRGDRQSRRHFSPLGQRRAAEMWRDVLLLRLRKPLMGVEAASFLLPDLHLLEPIWSADIVYRESSVLRRRDVDSPIEAKLAFPPAEILSVTSVDQQNDLDAFAHVTTSDPLHVRFEHPAPVEPIADADLFLPADAPHSYKHRVGHPDQNLLYRPGRWFHDRNVEFTYRRQRTNSPADFPSPVFGTLPKTLARLSRGEPVTIGVSGDSISTGLDASLTTLTAPFQPGYADLVAAQLQVLYDSEITLINRAVAGWSVQHGVNDLDNLLREKPHLIVVAYGMNDVGRRDPAWFGARTREIIERIQAADAETEILLVAPMLGNEDWVHTPREMFPRYRDELRALVAPGVALADVTAIWERLLQHKDDLDLTGNGLNHPNDFGHRLYAQALLALLLAQP